MRLRGSTAATRPARRCAAGGDPGHALSARRDDLRDLTEAGHHVQAFAVAALLGRGTEARRMTLAWNARRPRRGVWPSRATRRRALDDPSGIASSSSATPSCAAEGGCPGPCGRPAGRLAGRRGGRRPEQGRQPHPARFQLGGVRHAGGRGHSDDRPVRWQATPEDESRPTVDTPSGGAGRPPRPPRGWKIRPRRRHAPLGVPAPEPRPGVGFRGPGRRGGGAARAEVARAMGGGSGAVALLLVAEALPPGGRGPLVGEALAAVRGTTTRPAAPWDWRWSCSATPRSGRRPFCSKPWTPPGAVAAGACSSPQSSRHSSKVSGRRAGPLPRRRACGPNSLPGRGPGRPAVEK